VFGERFNASIGCRNDCGALPPGTPDGVSCAPPEQAVRSATAVAAIARDFIEKRMFSLLAG
jgi:hypothetical protein